MDLISRQAAIDAVDVDNLHRGIVEALQNIISELPSAEPEIVRCKDCKYYNPIGICIEMSSAVCEDSFCCWAERRTDDCY